MRTQAIAGLFDGREWHAESIDATGWIAEPATDEHSADSSPSGLSVVQQDAIVTREAAERRADTGREERGRSRSGRRARRVRHLRRMRTETVKSAVVIVDAPGRPGAGRRSPGRLAGSEVADSAVFAPPALDPAAAPSAAPDFPAEGYRLGRWARLALTVTALAAIVVVVVSLASGPTPQAMVDVTVAPGDTLWSIAAQAAPDRDPRDVIDEIRQLNDIQGGVLPIGVVLRVPAAVD